MQSALSPREIQAKLRAGVAIEQVAREAGVDDSYVDNFAGPVLAEREHAALLARAAQVRRRGEASSQRKLADTVLDKLAKMGIPEEDVQWDALREIDEPWTIRVTWQAKDDQSQDDQQALFSFDQRGRFSVAKDAMARILLDDNRAASPRVDPDSEPTIDLHDELAIVRAVQDETPQSPAVVSDHYQEERTIGQLVNAEKSEHSDWSEPELQEVDGVYDIAPAEQLDVLYDLLSGFNEDSVRIYTGLTKPPAENPAAVQVTTQAVVQTTVTPKTADAETTAEIASPQGETPDQPAAPAQDALAGMPPAPEPAHKNKQRRRAAVPSWDEIMFGSPQRKG